MKDLILLLKLHIQVYLRFMAFFTIGFSFNYFDNDRPFDYESYFLLALFLYLFVFVITFMAMLSLDIYEKAKTLLTSN
jgi:hypothetical protein